MSASSDLSGTWYLYKHSLTSAEPVLEKDDTLLEVMLKGEGYEMLFDVVDFPGGTHVRPVMKKDLVNGSWYGGVGRYDFRIHELRYRDSQILIGCASDRTDIKRRDMFVGVKTRRIVLTDDVVKWQHFDVYVLPLDRNPVKEQHFDLDPLKGEITWGEETYFLEPLGPRHPKGGQRFNAYTEGKSIQLAGWLLPTDSTESLFIAAHRHDEMHVDSSKEEQECEPASQPGNPHCTQAVFGWTR